MNRMTVSNYHRAIYVVLAFCATLAPGPWISAASAHIGDRIYPIYEIQDQDLGSFDFRDKTLSEWQDLVGLPSLSAKDFYADPTVGEGAPYNPADLDYQIWLGWNDRTNRLYVAQERVDNVYINTYPGGNLGDLWSYDSIEFMVDGDHSGGDYTGSADPNWTSEQQTLNNNRTAQQYVAIATSPDGRTVGYLGVGSGWVNALPYSDGGGASYGGNPNTSIMEFYVTPFDDLLWNSPSNSKVSDLAFDKIIGFQISVPDFDTAPQAYRAFHTLTGQAATWRYAERFADGRLIAAVVSIDPNAPKLSLPRKEGRVGEVVTIPVTLERASNIAGGDLRITYPSALLAFKALRNGSLIPGGKFAVVSNTSIEGQVAVSIAGSDAIGTASGTLLELDFQVRDFATGQPDSSTLQFSQASLTNVRGELIRAQQTSAMFKRRLGLLGDVNRDEKVTAADATLVLRFTVGLTTPTDLQRKLADVNEDTRVNAGDAVLILRKAVGLIAKPVATTWSTTRLAWGVPVREEDNRLVVPLLLEQEVHGLELTARYDSKAWKPVMLRTTEGVWVMKAEPAGQIQVTVASGQPLKKVELVLEPLSPASSEDLLSVEQISAVGGAGQPLEVDLPMTTATWTTGVKALPQRVVLLPSYPNPFNPETQVSYQLPQGAEVTLAVYSLTGQVVKMIDQGNRAAGVHQLHWDSRDQQGRPVGSGVYLLRLQAGSFSDTQRLTLIR